MRKPLELHEIENIRRSIAMLAPKAPSDLSRERAIALLEQLIDVTEERDRLRKELGELGVG